MIKRGFYGRSNHCLYSEALRCRKEYIKNFAIKVIVPPELNPYKQVELYKNFRKLVPQQYRDVLCPKPSPEVFARVENEKKQKKNDRKRKKVEDSEAISSSKKLKS